MIKSDRRDLEADARRPAGSTPRRWRRRWRSSGRASRPPRWTPPRPRCCASTVRSRPSWATRGRYPYPAVTTVSRERRAGARDPGAAPAAGGRHRHHRLWRGGGRLRRRLGHHRGGGRGRRGSAAAAARRRCAALCGRDRARCGPGSRTGDVSAAIQQPCEGARASASSGSTPATGSGGRCTRTRRCRTTARPGTGLPLQPGMTIALEPMVLAGGPETRVLDDQWTVASRDGRLTAHFEHTVAVTADGPRGPDGSGSGVWTGRPRDGIMSTLPAARRPVE